MKTAEEYYDQFKINCFRMPAKDAFWDAFNESRVEAIRECAEIAITTRNCQYWNCGGESVDKQSILNLIDQIK